MQKSFQNQQVMLDSSEDEKKNFKSKSVLLLVSLLVISGLIGAYVYVNKAQLVHSNELGESEQLFPCPRGTGRRNGVGPCIPYYEWVGGLSRYRTCGSVCGLRGGQGGGLLSGTYTRSRKPFYMCRGRSTGCGNDWRMGWNLYGFNTCRSPCGNGVIQTHNQCLCNNNVVRNTFIWVRGNGQSCGTVCGRYRGYYGVSSGIYSNRQRFYACRANGGNEGLRGGWNLIFGGYSGKCTVAWGNRQQLHTNFQCLCAKAAPYYIPDKFVIIGTNRAHNIYSFFNRAWHRVPGAARYASIGFDGTVWVINRYDHIYRTTHGRVMAFFKYGIRGLRGRPLWYRVPGALVDVSVGKANNVWGVNRYDYIYNWNGRRWQHVGGRLIDISVGADGSVLGVNRGHYIFRMRGNPSNPAWAVIPGRLKQIDHATVNLIVGVNAGNYIYGKKCFSNACPWVQFVGRARYSSVDLEGTVLVINRYDYVFFGRFDKLMARRNDWHVFPGRLISGEIRESFCIGFKNFALDESKDKKDHQNENDEDPVDDAEMPKPNTDEHFNEMPLPTEEDQ